MNPFTMFVLGMLSPVMLATTLLVPPYMGIAAACYIIYDKVGVKVHPLADKLYDVFYMLEVYGKLFSAWSKNVEEASVLSYSLPLLALPTIGVVLALGITSKLSRKLQHIFQMNSSF